MKRLWFTIALMALSFSTPIAAQTSPSPAGTYVIIQATIGNTPTTILLDSVNGKSWFLAQVDEAGRTLPAGQGGSATWIPLSFAAKVPPSPPR
jgi:P pilus assembly chaperone PapD